MAAEAVEEDWDAPEEISLEQYAGITAALADALPLDAVLDNEGLDPPAWRPIDAAWKLRLAAEGAGGPLFQSFLEKRSQAEDILARRVRPLDDDLGSWTAFLKAFGAHASPGDLLAAQGLGLPDLGRLQRRWARRFAADQELARKAAELSARAPAPLPALSVEPLVLKRFPWSPGPRLRAPAPGARPGEGAAALEELPLDRYAALRAELAEPRAELTLVAARYAIVPARFVDLDARWKQLLGADASLQRDYQRLFDYQRARLRRPAASASEPARSEPARSEPAWSEPARSEPARSEPAWSEPARSEGPPLPVSPVRPAPARLAGTALALDLPRVAPLPFAPGEAPEELREPSQPAEAPRARPPGLGGTALALEVPRGPAIPFAGAKEPPRGPHKLAGTALALEVPRGPALPFVEGEAPEAIRSASSEETPPARASSLGGTSLALDVPRGPALPFAKPHEEAKPRAPLSGTALAVELPRAPELPFVEGEAPAEIRVSSGEEAALPRPSSLGGTSLAVEVPRAPELPFAPDAAASAKAKKLGVRMFELPAHLRGAGAKTAPPSPPAAPVSAAPPLSPLPALSVEQYASLHVELSLAPGRAAEVLTRYRLNEAQRAGVERHFQERFQREAGLHAAFEQACATYRAWLRSQGRG